MRVNYQEIIKKKNEKYLEYLNKIRIVSFLRFIVFLLFVLFLCFINENNIYLFLAILCFGCFIVLIFIHDRFYQKKDYYERYLTILNEYQLRVTDAWDGLPNKGDVYINSKNTYLQDLDVLGQHSLYQFLCSAKTKQGHDLLYESLNNIELSNSKFSDRQNMIKELSCNLDFMLEFQVYLSFLEDDMDLEENIKYLDKKISRDFFLILTFIGDGLSILLFILGVFSVMPMVVFYFFVLFKYLFSYIYGLYYKEEFQHVYVLSQNSKKLTPVLHYLSKCQFKEKRLVEIVRSAGRSIAIIQKLDSLSTFSKLRDNFVANFIFNGLFTIDPYILYQYHVIQKKDSKDLKEVMHHISSLECLISLANVGVTKDCVCMPSREQEISLEFTNLKHPLLVEEQCVSNDYKNNKNVNIITGSNMSGKTSFLRTIGINLILANAGSYVCASTFTSSYLKIFTSMRVQDNIEMGISTFYGELLRIKDAIDYQVKGKPMIVFIDEIFKGTNYNDRILGATSIIKKLNKDNVILMITTHDFELCDVEEVDNYYFTEYYEKDHIKFDYKIRKGKCKTTNARYLMKRLHIIDDES